MCEVADTQSRKELKKRVQEYIIGTGGTVKIVILIKLERAKPQPKRKRDVSDDDLGVELYEPPGDCSEDDPRALGANSQPEPVEPGGIEGPGEADNAEEPVLPEGPPSRHNYSRGVFWVYSHEHDPERGANHARITCLENEQVTHPHPLHPVSGYDY